MPLEKALGKTKTSTGTHAHYAGEFGSTRLKGMTKDVAYRVGRAKHYADIAEKAAADHAAAKTDKERIEHLATLNHAVERSGVHAKAVAKLDPGSEASDDASLHAHRARQHLAATSERVATEKEEGSAEKKAAAKKEQEKRDSEKKASDERQKRLEVQQKEQADHQKRLEAQQRDQADKQRKIEEEQKRQAEKQKQLEAHQKTQSQPDPVGTSAEASSAQKAFAADGTRRALISQGRNGATTRDVHGDETKQFSVQSQLAIREHHDAIFKAYGLHNEDANKSGHKSIVSDDKMIFGGQQVYGSHGQGGDVELWGKVSDHLAKHAAQDPTSLRALGQRVMSGDKEAIKMVDAYRVSTHETLHGHGPSIAGGGASTMMDEITTEMAARRIVGDLHGIPSHQMPGSYDRYIHPVVEAAASRSGKSFNEAWKAVTDASLDHKRRAHYDDVEGRVDSHFAGEIMKKLGNHDKAAHADFAEHMYQIGRSGHQQKMLEKYPYVNRYQ